MKIAAFADLTPNTHPALTFSGWLASAPSEQTILAARHVIDEASVSLLLDALEGPSEIQRQAHAHIDRAVKAAGGTWQQVEVTSARTVLEGVTSCCGDLQPDLLVLARHGAHGPAFPRLGGRTLDKEQLRRGTGHAPRQPRPGWARARRRLVARPGHTTKHHPAFGTAADLASHLPVPVVTVPIVDA